MRIAARKCKSRVPSGGILPLEAVAGAAQAAA
jgi:hypothetical protein